MKHLVSVEWPFIYDQNKAISTVFSRRTVVDVSIFDVDVYGRDATELQDGFGDCASRRRER